MPEELNTQLQQELGVWLLVRIILVLLSCSLLFSPWESDTPSVSRGRCPSQQSLCFPGLDMSACCRQACQITPTILASCPQNIRFLQLMCGGCLLLPIPTPSSIRSVLFGVLLSCLVLIDFFFHFFFLSLGGSIAGCSRAEDLSTADQAEGEAGRPGAEMQPEQQLSQDVGASHQLRKGAWSR